jgi:hypothetical protein
MMLDPQVVFQAVQQKQDIKINPNTGIFAYLNRLNQGADWVPITEEFEIAGHRVLGISNTHTSEVRALYHKVGTSGVGVLTKTDGTIVSPPPNIRIFDLAGASRDMNFVFRNYGAEVIPAQAQPGEKVWRVVEIREANILASLKTTTLNSAGQPQPHVQVVRYWPDAPPLEKAMASRWKSKGVTADTKDDPFSHGAATFPIGGGDDYYRDLDKGINGFGVSAMWVGDPQHKSDLADRLGWISETQYRRLDFVFQLVQE